MKRPFVLLPCALLAVGIALSWNALQADAEKWLPEQFAAKYVKGQSADPKDVTFKQAVQKADCTICHNSQKGKGLNTYGREFKNLVRKRDMKSKENVSAAFDKIAGMKSSRNDPSAPTFGQLFEQGKLPPR
jgi:hypothetical protein